MKQPVPSLSSMCGTGRRVVEDARELPRVSRIEDPLRDDLKTFEVKTLTDQRIIYNINGVV